MGNQPSRSNSGESGTLPPNVDFLSAIEKFSQSSLPNLITLAKDLSQAQEPIIITEEQQLQDDQFKPNIQYLQLRKQQRQTRVDVIKQRHIELLSQFPNGNREVLKEGIELLHELETLKQEEIIDNMLESSLEKRIIFGRELAAKINLMLNPQLIINAVLPSLNINNPANPPTPEQVQHAVEESGIGDVVKAFSNVMSNIKEDNMENKEQQ